MTNTAEALLDALDRVITRHGPSGVTLRRVGDEAGLSHTAAAHYYRNKPGLFTAYITRAWHGVAVGVERAAEHPDDHQALLAAGRSYAEFARANPSAFSVMSRLELTDVDRPELWVARERGFFALLQRIEQAQANGWAAERTSLDVLAILWGTVHGIVDLWVGGPLAAPYDGRDLEDVLVQLLVPVLDGLDSPV